MDFRRTAETDPTLLWGDQMRSQRKNKRRFWYCKYLGHRAPGDIATAGVAIAGITEAGDTTEDELFIVDEYGNITGEILNRYSDPIEMTANISPATGSAQEETFGQLDNYDKVIVTTDLNCPINEQSVLFIDMEPEFTEVSVNTVSDADSTVLGNDEEESTYRLPKFNYIVRRVAKSLNSVSIAVSKVRVS